MTWNQGETTDTQLLDDFDAEVVDGGFTESYIPAEKARSGKATVSHQLLLVWRPLDQEGEVKDQPSWYSMGSKEFKFGGDVKEIELGDKTFELYPKVEEGPTLSKSSRMGMLVERLKELGFHPEGDSADIYLGLRAHVKREGYQGPGLESERQTLMPTELLGKGEAKQSTATTTSEDEVDDILIAAVVGKTEADVPDISKTDRVKALGLSAAKIYRRLDALVEQGKLVKDSNGVYQEG